MYKVKTRFGTTYNYILSWKVSTLDASFVEFTQSDNGKTDIVIIPKSEILSIS